MRMTESRRPERMRYHTHKDAAKGAFPTSYGNVVGQLLKPVPLFPATMTCGAVAALFNQHQDTPAFVIQLPEGRYGLAERNSYMTRYLDRYNRDIFRRRPITALVDSHVLVVDHDAPIEQVGLLLTTEWPDALKSAFVVTRDGAYAGIALGVDLMRAVAEVAEEASIAKSTFLTNMSHEIRTPLNAVIGNLELLESTSLNGEQADLVRMASISAHALLELIGDLLDLSKIEADQLEIEIVDCDVRAVVDEVITIARPRAQQKGLRLVGRVAAAVPAKIRSDPLRLRQVLLNFVGNAVKFTEAGGVYLTVRLETSDDGPPSLHFEVMDTGPGFDPARAAALFEPFVQEDVSTTRRFGGTGLGLAIAKRIVEILGGKLGCSTERGSGATFWCTIPISMPMGEAPDFYDSTPARSASVISRSAELAEALGAALATMGVSLSTASEGRPIHGAVILIDGDDPEEALKVAATLSDRGKVPILMTTNPSHGVRYRAHRLGVQAILRYPDEIVDLVAFIKSAGSRTDHSPAAGMGVAPGHTDSAVAGGVSATVLVIDDTGTNRELAARQLTRLGLTCDTAENGLVGLEKTEARRYAMILVDGSMPVMDGFEFARRFRERQKARADEHTPIIAVTAHALTGDAERFIAAGMDDYLAKPVTLEKLRGKLAAWLSQVGTASIVATESKVEVEDAVDRAALAALLGDDDPAAIDELLSIFVGDYRTLENAIAAALEAGDRNALARAAHAAKSAAGSAAAKELTALLARLEELAPAAEPDVLAALTRAAASAFARVAAAVKPDHS